MNSSELQKSIRKEIERYLPELKVLRQELHQIPELAFEEHKTSERLGSELRAVPGLELHDRSYAETGLVADIVVDKSAPWVLLRADMDALPIAEDTGLLYASQTPGKMHACGHDGHMACLIGAVKVLSELRSLLSHNIRFLFQPAEEGLAGAERMIKDGVLEGLNVNRIFGLHGMPEYPLGVVGSTAGPMLAAEDCFLFELKGKGGHAGFPFRGKDLLLVAAELMSSAQIRMSRRVPSREEFVFSFTTLEGNGSHNVLPDNVKISSTLRSFSADVRELVKQELQNTVKGLSVSYEVEIELEHQPGYPVLDCDRELFASLKQAFAEGGSFLRVLDSGAFPVSEDFSYFAQKKPSSFWLLGLNSDPSKEYPGLHDPRFDFNDEAIGPGVELHCLAALTA